MVSEALKTTLKRFIIVVLFTTAFAYIEAAVVVYLRTIFHPDGFHFPLKIFSITPLWRKLLLTEIGREAATIVVTFTGSFLSGRNRQQRTAYFLTIFAVWDLFYYVWLKVLIDWPASLMDWDVLFLIPVTWASPVLAPVLVSITMLAFAGVILYLDSVKRLVRLSKFEQLGLFTACLIVVISFCIAGLHITKPGFASHFSWIAFLAGLISAILLFIRCVLRAIESHTNEQLFNNE
jgi:hypothetical protein